MNYSGLFDARRRFRASVLMFAVCFLVPNIAAAPCSLKSSQQDAWVLTKINALVRAAHTAYENDKAERPYQRVVDGIATTMKQCRLAEDSAFVSRYPEFAEYVKLLSLARLDDHELGFTVSDQVYFAETRDFVTIPGFLLTPRFLRAVSRFETLKQAKALLREMNTTRAADDQLLFFSYESRHLGTPDNPDSFRRLLVVVPGNAAQNVPEKWVQFGIPDPRARARVRNLSIVAVATDPEKTTNVYFKDYFRTYRRDGSITIKGRWELGEGDDNCAQCHKSGVLPIFPVAGSVSRDELESVAAVNDRFMTYGPPRFGRYLDPSKFGPGLGSAGQDQFQSRYEQITSRTAAPNAVACGSCHHPNGLGALNWPMDRTIVSSFVEGGQMPFGARLQPAERTQLYRKLVQGYFAIDEARPGILKTWLLGQSR